MYVIACPNCGAIDILEGENNSFTCIVCDEEFTKDEAYLEEIKELSE